MQRTGDLRICLCALLCAGQGEGRLADCGHVFDREPGWSLFTFCQVCLLVVSLVASILPPPPPRPHTVCSVYSLSHIMVMYLLEKYLNKVAKRKLPI
jgi:hypothetical protein